MKPLINHPELKCPVYVVDYRKECVKRSYRALVRDIKAYFGYYVGELRKKMPKRKPNKEFLEKLDYWRKHKGLTVVTDDTVDAFKSMADGKMYTSKKAYRNELRGRGFDEIGNDTQEHLKHEAVLTEQAYDRQLTEDIEKVMENAG